ncbi:cuticle protein 65-like isoform X2 [Cylas formicarius]|uniref:cuticle protein 65-like isoform X2 n=1 Tax=Cylas formicarius TaxID=197179 RepID=UPI002958ADFA|nr:cuticle protein 65-like isoform X2 [Cylas formicarius]
MLNFILLASLVCYAGAGIIDYDGGYGGYGGIALAPKVAIAAPAIAVKSGAISYQNSNLLALNPTPVVTKVAAPIAVAKVAAPITYTKVATPILTKVATPIAVAAPAVSVVRFGKGIGIDDGLGAYGGYGFGYGGIGIDGLGH